MKTAGFARQCWLGRWDCLRLAFIITFGFAAGCDPAKVQPPRDDAGADRRRRAVRGQSRTRSGKGRRRVGAGCIGNGPDW